MRPTRPGPKLFAVASVLVAGICVSGCGSRQQGIAPVSLPQRLSCDLDADGTREIVHISGTGAGGNVVVLQVRGGQPKQVWTHSGLNPWKLQIADVDGDGKWEIVVGVEKKSPRDPVIARRVFVYSWNGERMVPKWLGSRLARRFDDFALADIDSDGWHELTALERMPGNSHRVSLYRWRSFGFDWLGCTDSVTDAISLDAAGQHIVLSTRHGSYGLDYRRGIHLVKTEGSFR